MESKGFVGEKKIRKYTMKTKMVFGAIDTVGIILAVIVFGGIVSFFLRLL